MSEQGKIIINQVKKGFEYKVEFVNKNGKTVQPTANDYEFDLGLKDKPCEFEMDDKTNKFVWIKADGKEIPKKAAKTNPNYNKTQKEFPRKSFDNRTGSNISKSKVNDTPAKNIPDSFYLPKTKIPTNIRKSGLNKIDNFNLKLNRAARFDSEKKEQGKDKFLFFRAKQGTERKDNYVSPFQIQPDFSKVDFKIINETYEESINGLYPLSNIRSLVFKPEWRMIVGLGNESIYEVSMTLHHIYGFPYIPASAIKGVTRHWVIINKFGVNENGETDLKKAEMRALQDKNFCDIFGCPAKDSYKDEKDGIKKTVVYETAYKDSKDKEVRKGNVIFFDAMPIEAPKIEVDIMNPHYGDYYAGKKPPADYLSPNPIPFLTVTETPFQFFIALSKNLTKDAFNDEKYQTEQKERVILDEVSEYLTEALSQNGIGAKAAIGYGILEKITLNRLKS